MRNATSVKERLKNYAKKNNRIVQDIFTVYVPERTLYRISVSDYRDKFTLKGGILLYGLYTEDFTRATTELETTTRFTMRSARLWARRRILMT